MDELAETSPHTPDTDHRVAPDALDRANQARMLDLATEIAIRSDIPNPGLRIHAPIPVTPEEILDVRITSPPGNIRPAAGQYQAMTIVSACRLSDRYDLAQNQAINACPRLLDHPGRRVRIDAVRDERAIKGL